MYKEKICPICNKPFIPKSSRQKYCNEKIERICPICGNTYISICNIAYSKCCSKQCSDEYANRQRQSSYKAKECKWCGKLFYPRSNTQLYCDDIHYATCQICSEQYIIDLTKQDKRKTCSKECADKLRFINGNPFSDVTTREAITQTNLSRYGTEYPIQNPDIQAKQQNTMIERYGVPFYSQTSEYTDKIINTNLKRYGTSWPTQSDKVRDKTIQTNLDRYGVSNPMQNPDIAKKVFETYEANTGYKHPSNNPEVQHKIRISNLDKYGVEHYSQTDEFKRKFENTSLKHFGVSNPMQAESVKLQSKQTCLDRYGADNYFKSEIGKNAKRRNMIAKYGVSNFSQSSDWKTKMMSVCDDIDKWLDFTNNPEVYINKNYSQLPTYYQLSKDLGTRPSSVCDFICRKKLSHLIKRCTSYVETELIDYIHSIDSNIKIELHDRKLIDPYELDLYLPEYHIAFECNPTATHNSSIPDPWGGEPKHYMYHQMKTELCENKGIFLFHIFGYEWTNKRPIIESMIKNLLNKNSNKYYARQCEIRHVDTNATRKFLDENHRQGFSVASVRLGLYHKDELVSLMTFNKKRHTIGPKLDDNSYELVRFCSKLDSTVVGGADKLFKHFIKTYDPTSIISFSDRAHTRGNLYKKLGFVLESRSHPGYVWVDSITDIAYHRMNAQKRNIKQFLGDENIDLSQTEKQIMESHGFVIIYDSGIITWRWNK